MPLESDGEWKYFGETSVRLEPPDTLHSVFVGLSLPARMSAICDEYDRLTAGMGHVFHLVDIHRTISGSMKARRVLAQRTARIPFGGTAVIGGGVQIRALARVVIRAFELLNPRFKEAPTRFFDREEQARAWIAERRRIVQREGSG
jgi:hypothetical protein